MRLHSLFIPVLLLLFSSRYFFPHRLTASWTSSATARSDTARANQYLAKAQNFAQEAQYDSSNFYFEKAGEIYQSEQDWANYVKCQYNLGRNFVFSGELEPAGKFLHHALSIASEKLGNTHLYISEIKLHLGNFHYVKGDYEKALDFYEQSLHLARQNLGVDHPDLAKRYMNIGNVRAEQGESRKALEFYEKALSIQRKALGENHAKIADSYENIGLVYLELGYYDEALVYLNQALSIRLKILRASHPDLATNYLNIGVVLNQKGDDENALDRFEKALPIFLSSYGEDHADVATAYNNIAEIYNENGDYDRALEYHQKALSIRQRVLGEKHPLTALSYNNIGGVLGNKEEYGKALEFFRKALALYIEAYGEKHRSVALCLNNVGNTYHNLRQYDQALEFHQKALSIRLETLGDKHPEVANSYRRIGTVYAAKGDYDTAREHLNKALSISLEVHGRKHPEIASVYNVLGEIHHLQGEFEKALDFHQQSIIALAADFDNPDFHANPRLENISSEKELLNTLVPKAQALEKLHDLHGHESEELRTALSTSSLALALVDKMRRGYRAEGSKLFLGTEAAAAYAAAIRIALKLQERTGEKEYRESAYEFAQKSKVNVLLESVRESQARQFGGVPDSLLEKEKNLKIDLAFYDTELQKEKLKREEQDSVKIKDFENRFFALNVQYQKLIAALEQNYPQYLDLKYRGRPVSVAELQKSLDGQSALLEYFVADSSLYLFTIAKDDFRVAALPIDTTFANLVEVFCLSTRKGDARQYLKTAPELYNLLIRPVAPNIASKQKLIIIPHDILCKVPFEALLKTPFAAAGEAKNATRVDFRKLDYLVKHFEITYHYSATLYVKSRQEQEASLAKGKQPLGSFIGFAPVFREGDATGYTLASADLALVSEAPDETVRAIMVEGKRFGELKHTEAEVKNIVKLFAKKVQGHESVGHFFTAATEQKFKATIRNHRYVHIATHGFINEAKPALSGIVFAQPTDSTAADDGVLYTGETYNLDMDADLVVLSSCESGLGRLIRGEGLMALTRGFLYSGASNLMFSLWKVTDKHTSELMIEFYRQVLDGKDYAGALRQTKLKMMAKAATASPRSWSSFVLIGVN